MTGLKFWHQFGNGYQHTESIETAALVAKYNGYVRYCDIDIDTDIDTDINTGILPPFSFCKVQLVMCDASGKEIGLVVLSGYVHDAPIAAEYMLLQNTQTRQFSAVTDTLDDILCGWVDHLNGTANIHNATNSKSQIVNCNL